MARTTLANGAGIAGWWLEDPSRVTQKLLAGGGEKRLQNEAEIAFRWLGDGLQVTQKSLAAG